MFKMVFLQFLYDLSDRQLEEQATWNMMFKCFPGLSAEELPPDHTPLCRFRLRLGAEGFQKLFNLVQAREKGLVSDRLHIIDATHPTAKVNLFRLKKEHREAMMTTLTWTGTPRTRTPLRPQDSQKRVQRLQKPYGSGRRLQVYYAGGHHSRQCP